MNSVLLGNDEEAGFSFRNCRRNENLLKSGFKPPITRKTGTTICGVTFKDGVIMGADSKATKGDIADNKNCQKIYYIQDNMYCCGAGTAADMEMTTRYVSVNMELLRRNTERKIVPIDAAITFTKRYLFSYNGRFSNYLIFGGVDNEGPHIRAVYPHGSADKLPFATMGSGSLAAISIFESRWEPDMSQEDAIKLVCDATNAGVYNDLGSGYGVDIVVIRKDFHKMLRGVDVVEKTERKLNYTPKRGTTGVLTCSKIEIEIEEEEVIEHDKMDLD